MSGPRGRDQEGLPFDGIAGSEGQEVLSGAVERVTFQNEETGFCVLRVQPRFGRERVAVVGHAPPIKAGEFLRAEGRWVDDPRHGPQFRAESIATQAPVSAEGIERYLGSGLVVGIGPELAKRMVATFGVGVLDVIDETPERLREVPGVGRVRLERIRSAWSAQKRVREIMIFLHGHGIGTVRAARIHRFYGDDAVERIRSDPWALARDIPGVGFATADALADRLGVSRTALSRARAGVRQIIDDAVRAGDCGLPREDLLRRAEALLGVDTAVVETGLAAEVEARELIAADGTDGPGVFVPALFHAEADAAVRLRAMLRGSPPWAEIDSGKAIPWVEAKLGLVLATGQHEALDRALHSRLLVLTGGPGVGKTTLVRALFEILAAKRVRVLLAAPTGRAAKRLAEATAAPASTLHRLLEARPGRRDFGRNPSNPLEVDLLVVDEASMVDVPLLAGLLRALPEEAAVLWIGDPAQLPSVGPGRVLADMIDSGVVPVVALSEIFRQAAQSRIVRAAHRVLAGEMPELASVEGSDFFFLEEEDAEVAAQRIVKLVAERIPGRLGVDAIRDVQVLSPMHRGSLGTKALNRGLQRALNPAGLAGPRVLRFETAFCVGDKVMQMRNDYDRDVFNGDVGFVAGIEPEKQTLRVAFDRGEVEYAFDELDALALAYATTVHKAQGSEYPVVVFPLHGQHTPMLRRNLVYTAMTRGRRLVVIVGQKRSLAAAVRSAPEEKRFTRLALELVPRSRARVQ